MVMCGGIAPPLDVSAHAAYVKDAQAAMLALRIAEREDASVLGAARLSLHLLPPSLEFVRIVEVRTQIVAGVLVHLLIEAHAKARGPERGINDAAIVSAKVWRRLDDALEVTHVQRMFTVKVKPDRGGEKSGGGGEYSPVVDPDHAAHGASTAVDPSVPEVCCCGVNDG